MAKGDSEEAGFELLSTDRLREAPIFGLGGHKLGILKSFLVESATGRIRYAVISTDGFLGPGPDCRPLPFAMLAANSETPGFTVEIDAEALQAAPHYLDGEEPDRFFWARLDAHYGQTPLQGRGNPLLLAS